MDPTFFRRRLITIPFEPWLPRPSQGPAPCGEVALGPPAACNLGQDLACYPARCAPADWWPYMPPKPSCHMPSSCP